MKRAFATMTLLLALLLVIGCDAGLKIVAIEITKFPQNIVYYVGEESQLDFSGGEVTVKVKEGSLHIYPLTEEEFDIVHSVDFNKEGVYTVEVLRTPEIYDRFPIQVIKREP